MNCEKRPTYSLPGGMMEIYDVEDDGMVNDALGSIDLSDSTGIDDEMETGDAKTWNFPTRED